VILKNFINLFNLNSLLLFILFIYLINNFLILTQIRKKFLLLLPIILLISGIGFYYNLDGLVMMFLVSELSVILIFIVMFSQLFNYNYEKIHHNNMYLLIIIFILNFNYYEYNLLKYNNYYSYYNIVLNDFYYIYNTYFEKQILITVLITLIITFYSIFFILLYFNLKKNLYNNKNIKKNLYLLRKQNIIHQSNYNTKIRFFKN
jgi:hypothetical protein